MSRALYCLTSVAVAGWKGQLFARFISSNLLNHSSCFLHLLKSNRLPKQLD